MGMFDRFNKSEVPTTVDMNVLPTVIDTSISSVYDMISMKFESAETPKIVEIKNKDWVYYGKDNSYYDVLIDLYNSCPMHQSIVNRKSMMVAGAGFTFSSLPTDPLNIQIFDNFVNKVDGVSSLKELVDKISFDYKLMGAFALECIWSVDFKKIVKVKWLDITRVRSGKEDARGEVSHYYYSKDFNSRKPVIIKLAAFDTTNKTDYSQILYVKNKRPGIDYYGSPDYTASINWITLDASIGMFHKSNIENGFQPSFAIKFFKRPNSPEEKQIIEERIRQNFGGKKNVGKAMIFFSDGKELAPEVTPIEVSNIDKQFTIIADQVVNQIMSGHGVTSPELFGISVPGIGSSDITVGYNIFQNTVVRPDQMTIENALNKILKSNGMDTRIEITPFNPTIIA